MNKKITDLERHRVMIPHAKVSNWILWRKNISQWTKKEWQEFEAVKAGAKPSLLDIRKHYDETLMHRDAAIFRLTSVKTKKVYEGTAFQLSKIIGVDRARFYEEKVNGYVTERL